MEFFRSSQGSRRSQSPEPDPADVQQMARRAAICAGDGRTDEALRCYQMALLLDEERPDLWFNYGALQRRLGHLADAIESFDFALRLDPTMYTARYNRARICCDTGRPLEALQEFEAIVRQRPGYIPAWRQLVQLTWALGGHDDAVALAQEALKVAPGDAELELLLERVLQDQQELPTVL